MNIAIANYNRGGGELEALCEFDGCISGGGEVTVCKSQLDADIIIRHVDGNVLGYVFGGIVGGIVCGSDVVRDFIHVILVGTLVR